MVQQRRSESTRAVEARGVWTTWQDVIRRVVAVRSVPLRVLALTATASAVGAGLSILAGWPLWPHVLVALVPWGPVLTLETAWTWRHYSLFALFYVLVAQTGHLIEQ